VTEKGHHIITDVQKLYGANNVMQNNLRMYIFIYFIDTILEKIQLQNTAQCVWQFIFNQMSFRSRQYDTDQSSNHQIRINFVNCQHTVQQQIQYPVWPISRILGAPSVKEATSHVGLQGTGGSIVTSATWQSIFW